MTFKIGSVRLKYLLMYNPVSGKREFYKQVPYVIEYFRQLNLNLDVYESKCEKDLESKATEISGLYDVIMIAGGDGTINEVINGVMATIYRPSLAFLPAGTANDVASLLGFNKDIERSLDIIIENKPIKMDINKLNDRYFVYATAAGILTKVSYDVSRKKVKKYGYFAYLADGFKDIFKDYSMKMCITHKQGVTNGNFMLVLSLSSRRVAGLFLNKFSEPKLDDGLLEMRLIETTKRFKILKLLLFFVSGGRKRGKDIHLTSDFYNIDTSDDIIWNTDGEKSTFGSIKIRTYYREISVFVSDESKTKFFSKDNR